MLYVISIIGICLSMLTMAYIVVVNRKKLGEAVSANADGNIHGGRTIRAALARGDRVLVAKKNGRNIPATFLGNGFGKAIVLYRNGCTFRRTNVFPA